MLEKSQIQGLLPHQGSMFLLDRVIGFDDDTIECGASSHRHPDNPLRHHGQLAAYIGAEYGAQAAGIHGGLLNDAAHPGAATQMGYLAVISKMQWSIERLDNLPGELRVHARRSAVLPGGCAYHVRIDHQSITIVSADLIIALKPGST